MVIAEAVAVHLVAAAALVETVVAIVLNHVAHLALKATAVVIASKAVVIGLKIVHQLPVLKVVAIHAPRLASSLAATSAANNAASLLAAKLDLNPVAISAKMLAVKTALTLATPARLAHQVVSKRAAVPVIVLRAVLKSSVLATSSHTMRVVTQPLSVPALKC